MPTASTSSKQEPFVPSYERAELTREAELRRLQTVNFLSKLQKDGIASEIRRTSNERIDEKCYFKCWQPRPQPASGERRTTRKEPSCRATCFIKVKDEAAPTEMQSSKKYFAPKAQEPEDAKYRFSALQGRYLYVAKGRMAIAKHAETEVTPEIIRELEDAQAVQAKLPATNGDRLDRARQAAMVEAHSERLYPLCTIVSSRLQRFENHLVRIYGPTYRLLARLPEIYNDGSYRRISGQIFEKAQNGDGLVLGRRLLENGVEMTKKLIERASSGGGGFGGFGGLGGFGTGGGRSGEGPGEQPPAPPQPPLAPPPAPPAA